MPNDTTARLKLDQLVSLQELNAVTWNEALAQLDALVDLYLLGLFGNTPPSSPQDGDAYITGGAPTGAWSGQTYKIAACLDGAWRFFYPFNGLRAYVASSGIFVIYLNGQWLDCNGMMSSSETYLASSSTCDLANANSLFVQITGTSTIASFGTAPNKVRFVRFAQSLTLTHNASSLILLGGASRTTAAGDCAIYTSDGSGTWRERAYFRAAKDAGAALVVAGSAATGGLFFADNSGRAAQSGNLVWDTSGNRLLIGSGAVGINTNSPVAQLDVAGHCYPHAANSYDLGSASYGWRNGFIQNAWTVLSDENAKDDIVSLSVAELAVAREIAPLVTLYKMKSAMAEKGAGARIHCGWIAQRIVAAFAAHGLDAFAYGCVGKDLKTKVVTRTRTVSDDDGNTVEETYDVDVPDLDESGVQKTVFSIRPDEVVAFALAGLSARLAALENGAV